MQTGGGWSRIARSSEYRSIYEGGRKTVGRYYVMFYRPSVDGSTRVGITVSGKVGGAVVRNRTKRRTREALKKVLVTGGAGTRGADMVFVALRRIVGASFDELVRDISSLISRAGA